MTTSQSAGRDPEPKGPDTGVGGIKFAPLDCGDEDLREWKIVNYGIEQLQKKHEQPLFLAVGLHKPHMPWNVPRKYYDMHPLDKIELPPYREDDLEDLPRGRRAHGPARWRPCAHARVGPLERSHSGLPGRHFLLRRDGGAAAGRVRQVALSRQHDHLLLGRPRLAPGREAPLAEVRALGGVHPRALHLGRARPHQAQRPLRPRRWIS